jgi:hypothetical protein
MISIGKKLFDEIDMPKSSEVINENEEKGMVEMESSWTGQIKGLGLFRSGRVVVMPIIQHLEMPADSVDNVQRFYKDVIGW